MTRAFTLSRRAALRGLGAGLALPVLDAMLDSRGLLHGTAHAQARALPVRLFTLVSAYGPMEFADRWTPSTDGAGYALTPCLRALAPVRDHVTVISGLSNQANYTASAVGGGHARGRSLLLTCRPLMSATRGAGISFDQVAAQARGSATRLGSLVACVRPSDPSSGEADQISNFVFQHLAWTSPTSPVPPERDPQALFNRLFGGAVSADAAAAAARDRARRSVIDYSREEARRLAARLGAVDRARLDEHLTSIRALELELGAAAAACARPAAPGDTRGQPLDVRARLLVRLLVLALKCDLARDVVFDMNFPFGTGQYGFLGGSWPGQHRHALSHDRTAAASELNAQAIAWDVGVFAELVAQLRDSPEGTGTLLDNTLACMTYETAYAWSHRLDDMPVLLAGRAGGAVRTGRHVRVPRGTPLANLYAAMLSYAGMPTPRFGANGTEPLRGLDAS